MNTDEITPSMLAKLDEYSLKECLKFFARQIKKNEEMNELISAMFSALGDSLGKKAENYDKIHNALLCDEKLSKNDKLVCLSILNARRAKNLGGK